MITPKLHLVESRMIKDWHYPVFSLLTWYFLKEELSWGYIADMLVGSAY